MKSKCKTCGKNCDGEYCFIHKPRKPLIRRTTSSQTKPPIVEDVAKMRDFFLGIWNKRKKHECENCGEWLGKEPLSYMFDHLLEKKSHPELRLEEENIMLVCLKCHDEKTRGFASDYVKNRINIVKQKYEGTQ
jgi:5-methylcytosine-specific restriction endonuclease McrA